MFQYDLTIACVFQNEAPYLKEWLEYHRMIGVQHFVLVEDRSTDQYMEVLQPYLDRRIVELFHKPCPQRLQGDAWPEYQRTIHAGIVEYLRGVTRWLALTDTDEFIVPMKSKNVVSFLEERESYGGLYLRWEPFGTSYIEKLQQSELLTQRLCLKWRFRPGQEMLGKSIVRPEVVFQANIHRCELLPNISYFDSNPGMQNENPDIKLHHYWSRDIEFLLNTKLPRSSQIKGWEIDEQRKKYFLDLFNDVPDYSMRRFGEQLERRVLELP